MPITYIADDEHLSTDDFLALAETVWPGSYDRLRTARALQHTLNITARCEGQLIGCVRILSDGYFFSTLPEILVHPDFQGGGRGTGIDEIGMGACPHKFVLRCPTWE